MNLLRTALVILFATACACVALIVAGPAILLATVALVCFVAAAGLLSRA